MRWLLDVTGEQRKSARTWALILSGPALLAVLLVIVIALVWVFTDQAALRIHWLGWIAIALASLLAIAQLTYALDQALRYIKFGAGSDGVSLEAKGGAPSEEAPQ